MLETGLALLALGVAAALWFAARLERTFEQKHRQMLADLHAGLREQAERTGARLAEELDRTREALGRLQAALGANLAEAADRVQARLDTRLAELASGVGERLDDGFRRTNETFVNVMQRLSTIDEAQKRIETLADSVVALEELLGDKRARGAFGEVQLEAIVRNALPPSAWAMQVTLSNGARADCVLKLPEPTGAVCVDAKFPLENYHRMYDPAADEAVRAQAARQFRADVKKHVEDIARKYIVPGETADGAVMFVPAEAVFAEIHASAPEVVEYAQGRRVWIVSPTTLMAVLNTARAVLRDVETRRQVHVIREAIRRLAVEFQRFDERLRALATHIRQAHEDAQRIQSTGERIGQQFERIEAVELDENRPSGGAALAQPPEGRPADESQVSETPRGL